MGNIRCVWEHNGNDTILYAENYIGAFARGESRKVAVQKMDGEVRAYLRWAGEETNENFSVQVVQEKESTLEISEADSDVIFETEIRIGAVCRFGRRFTEQYRELQGRCMSIRKM